jgi:futalosine hydrolase
MGTGDILIAAAVDDEMAQIRENLTGAAASTIGQLTVVRGRIGTQTVRLVVTGPGLANTVHGLTVAITAQTPKLILQTGCGGGFKQAGLGLGDVAVASAEIDAQLGLAVDKTGVGLDALPFPVIRKGDREIFSHYPVAEAESDRAFANLLGHLPDAGVKVHKGPFITVSSVTGSAARAADLHQQYGAVLENMEGVGAAHVAALYDISFLEIRAVSNRVGERDKSRWDLPLAFENCARAVQIVLENRPV